SLAASCTPPPVDPAAAPERHPGPYSCTTNTITIRSPPRPPPSTRLKPQTTHLHGIGDNCHLAGTQYGATAVSQCSRLNLPAGTIIYYLYPSPAALASGVSRLLSDNHFHKSRECTTGNDFTDFLVECQTDFHNQTPFMTGS